MRKQYECWGVAEPLHHSWTEQAKKCSATFLLVKVGFIETVNSTTRNSSPPAPDGSLYYRGPIKAAQ